jgi:DNA-binding CsgD family transcriptional regulator
MKGLIFLLIYAVFFSYDLYHDHADGVPMQHIWHELFMFAFTIFGIIALSIKITKQRKNLSLLKLELDQEKTTNTDWKTKSLGAATLIRQLIDEQFALWHLSQSEKDVALLLIKGFSMKEIAEIRSTQEKTVRQQAMSIYKKSSLSGRQQLAAFFLEDILAEPEVLPKT